MRCGHCGASHATIDDVRRCAALHPEQVASEGPWDGRWTQGPIAGLTKEAWDDILLSWQRRCAYCGAAVGTQAEREHNIPLDANGPNNVSNIVPSCTLCNSAKGSYDGQTYHRLRAERGLSTHPMWHEVNPAASDPVLSEIFAEPADNCPCTVSR